MLLLVNDNEDRVEVLVKSGERGPEGQEVRLSIRTPDDGAGTWLTREEALAISAELARLA